ncbi:hypothetical protein F5B19DRAFT_355120 [Rostrohypoxylon terebratum]|nr:hypothetical protein F5B19DRAFT_355120 [Rostrohypoxylon terebratum]
MQYLELFASYHGQPSNSSQGVPDAFLLAPGVIQRRIDWLCDYEKETGLSDDEVYSHVWEPSIDMLVNVERLLLKREDEYHSLNEFKLPRWNLPLHVRKFLDTLGQSRDKLWQEHRAEKNPIICELEAPWPRGLPIQHLVPIKVLIHWKDMPYIESRAKAILFAPGETLKSPAPTQVEKKAAIGPFVNDFIFALHVFISAVDEGPQQDDRILQAWDHAVGNFTYEGMSHKGALVYWKHFFSLVPDLIFPDTVLSLFETPVFEYDLSGIIVEWTPHLKPAQFPSISTVAELPGQFPKSCLDCMLVVHKLESSKTVHSFFQFCDPNFIRATTRPSIRDIWRPKTLTPLEETDAIVTIALAFLDIEFGFNSCLLKQSFPSEDDSRFPALQLNGKTLKDEDNLVDLSSAWWILEHLSSRIPAFLFQRLARLLWKRLVTVPAENSEILKTAIRVLKILSRGDRPDIALEFLTRSVFKHQENNL